MSDIAATPYMVHVAANMQGKGLARKTEMYVSDMGSATECHKYGAHYAPTAILLQHF